MGTPDCYKCRYRCDIPGDCHSKCRFGLVALTIADSYETVIAAMGLHANRHGIEHGWFMWPFNFDPIWLESCKGFKEVSGGS